MQSQRSARSGASIAMEIRKLSKKIWLWRQMSQIGQNLDRCIGSAEKIFCHDSPMSRLRVVPHFASGIEDSGKRERAWKSPYARKGNTRRGERKMRDYRQSPSFWPFTADWFWSVKFVSPSKSIKHIQWDSFLHWAVIALVIGKLQGIFIASKRKPRY